jgi:hypothetical protein
LLFIVEHFSENWPNRDSDFLFNKKDLLDKSGGICNSLAQAAPARQG